VSRAQSHSGLVLAQSFLVFVGLNVAKAECVVSTHELRINFKGLLEMGCGSSEVSRIEGFLRALVFFARFPGNIQLANRNYTASGRRIGVYRCSTNCKERIEAIEGDVVRTG